ncbi:bestrophin-like domain [Spirosoma validum]|uniref:DUF4239 domain-containing protein n=1 Tax=Spirosoma validum TaxID=2771355 RepID=A0A927B6P5_9BACT|nr:DUF4239 domain-containing protein [Spirosoma validum]MBD2756695.1 DUF4239 domain-containing protein [Spirosoma validum]
MSLSYYLLQLPPVVMLCLLIALFAGIGVGGTFVYRKYVRPDTRPAGNEVIGDVFASVGALYGLLLGFVVFLVWDSFNSAQINANREGSLARTLYRAIRYYPDSTRIAPVMKAYSEYVYHVVNHEYPRMEKMKSFTKEDRRAFNGVYKSLENVNLGDSRTDLMFRHLNELATYRSLRQLDATTEIPGAIWLALLAGGVLVLVFAMILDVKSGRLHLIANGLLSTFVGLIIYIILMLDHPFTGSIRIEPTDYNQIMIMKTEDM